MLAPSIGAMLLTRLGAYSIGLTCMCLLLTLIALAKSGVLHFDDWESKSQAFLKQVAEMDAANAALEVEKVEKKDS